jgi:hypothetical protein
MASLMGTPLATPTNVDTIQRINSSKAVDSKSSGANLNSFIALTKFSGKIFA